MFVLFWQAAIRRAYRKLAVRYHPDKYKVGGIYLLKYLYQPYLPPSHFQGTDALEKFQLITTAYEVSICRHCYSIAALAMYTTRPVGRGGSSKPPFWPREDFIYTAFY